MNPIYDQIARASGFQNWKSRTSSPVTRYHHRLPPPLKLIPGYSIREVERPHGQRPALDKVLWRIIGEGSSEPAFGVLVSQYATVEAAHEGLLWPLMSITRMGVDYTPVAGGPGDVRIQDEMARDNLMIELTSAQRGMAQTVTDLLAAVDGWILSDWASASAKHDGPGSPLAVELSTEAPSILPGAPLRLHTEVKRDGIALDLMQLSHCFTADPGRVEWTGEAYIFRCEQRGRAKISLEVLAGDSRYGRASAQLEVR